MSFLFQPEIPLWSDYSSRTALTVGQLTKHLSALLDSDVILQDVWVRGEASNVTYHGSGHLYFGMKDADACVRCVMWRTEARGLGFVLEPGMQILAHGRMAVYEKRGDVQLIVDAAEPDGLGALYLAFEQLKARLEAEGLFAPERKRPIPTFPRCVAIVTSPTGAVLHDVVTILRRRCPAAALVLVPARVQGDGAPESLARAIGAANEAAGADVLIVARGGGSLEDLWAFNSEIVARAIAASRLPVVSAVGHETDVTIADFVADLRAPTPSAAAELVVPDGTELMRRLTEARERLQQVARARLRDERAQVEDLLARRAFARPLEGMNQRRQALDDQQDRLLATIGRHAERARLELAALVGRLDALSPLAVLARGYAVVTREADGAPVRSRDDAAIGERLRLRLRDGDLAARVVGPRDDDSGRIDDKTREDA
jgi:exodeoxyribonuclease VII large subunit